MIEKVIRKNQNTSKLRPNCLSWSSLGIWI